MAAEERARKEKARSEATPGEKAVLAESVHASKRLKIGYIIESS